MTHNIRITVHLVNGTADVHEAQYPHSSIMTDQDAFGFTVNKGIAKAGGATHNPADIINRTVVVYPLHTVKRVEKEFF